MSQPSSDAAPESEAWTSAGSVRTSGSDNSARSHGGFRLENEEVAGRGR